MKERSNQLPLVIEKAPGKGSGRVSGGGGLGRGCKILDTTYRRGYEASPQGEAPKAEVSIWKRGLDRQR